MFRVYRNRLLPATQIAGRDIPLVYTVVSVNKSSLDQKKEGHQGGRPTRGATEKLNYRIGVKMAAADYLRLLTLAHDAGT